LLRKSGCPESTKTEAQTVRSYATRQAVKTSVSGTASNASFAIDGNTSTHSTLSQPIFLGLGTPFVEQILDFNPGPASTSTYATAIPANTPITVKVEMPSATLNLMSRIEVQAITGLGQTSGVWDYTNVGTAISGNSLLSLLSGNGSNEITITPNVAFQGIRVRVSTTALLSLAINSGVYHAYIKVPASGNIACNSRIDVLSGVMPVSILGVLSTTASVTNPWAAIDLDMTTQATLNTGVDVLNKVYHTSMFNNASKVGDTLKLTLQGIGGNLLSVGALTGFTIKLYNGANLVQTITNNPALLSLKLLNPVGNMMEMSVVPNVAFDKVEISIGGVLNAFSGIRIYDVERKNAGVLLTTGQADIYVYAGQSYTLDATAMATGDNVAFYDAQTNGNVMSAAPTATTEAQSGTTMTFYAGATRGGCLESSDRKSVNVHVIGFIRNLPAIVYVGQPYNSDIIVTDTNAMPLSPDFQYTTSSILPAGLSMDPQTGIISGMPTSMDSVPPMLVTIFDMANNLPVGTFSYPFTILMGAPLGIDNILSCKADRNKVFLNWITYAGTANTGFMVERSHDAKKFIFVGAVNNKAKSEDENGVEYKFTDKQPDAGINYYRLKQTGKDGKIYYSNVVSAFVSTNQSVFIYPNPVQDNLNIRGENLKAISIYNAAGQMVLSQINIEGNNIDIDVSSLANGLHSVKIEGEYESSTKGFIVNH
jgi:hypothetical protein